MKIKKITVKEKQDVYDIQVRKNENFYANGVLVHNCEIALRPYQFCNLCEVNVSNVTSQEDLNNRAKAAAFIGTLQAGYTDFHYLRDVWKKTTKKDALIGVGMTGIGSGYVFKYNMTTAAFVVQEENKRVANLIGINSAARCTTVKPSGTSSLVVGSSSGIHAWHNEYYVRRMRIGKNESIYKYLKKLVPELLEDEIFSPHSTAILKVPQKAPDKSILRSESALELLSRVKFVYENWVKPGHNKGMNTHNISATVSIKNDEWEGVGEWMWKNRNCYNGLSVLPYDGGSYKQAPFEDITKEEFIRLKSLIPEIDLTSVLEYDDNTDLKGEIACGANGCELV
jgi:ribonucleoside-diphosphate reductase alpha chain